MRIQQAYISQSVIDFPFLEKFDLVPYNDIEQPCIFFGCYTDWDLLNIIRHKGFKIVFWCGQDAKDFKDFDLMQNCFHVTGHPHIIDLFTGKLFVHYAPPPMMLPEAEAVKMGNKIFAYCPFGHPSYHKIDVICNLKTKYDIILGDGSIPQSEWHEGKNNEIYSQCFIGLVLNDFAGGGQTIIELGIRGITCVTNVLEMPHTVKWRTPKDIEKLIVKESAKIGTRNTKKAAEVLNFLDTEFEFLNTEFYL